MWVMYDSVDVATIPRSATAVAGYTSGYWPTYWELQGRWPHAHRVSIAISRSHDADCLDIERGDAEPGDAPDWVRRQLHRGVSRPILYQSASVVGDVLERLRNSGIHREAVRIWSAHYTYVPHLCGPQCGLSIHADATQWTSSALGRNLDESLCADNFFGAPWSLNLSVLTEAERDLADSLILYRKHPHLHEHGIRVSKEGLVQKRREVWAAADREIKAGKPSGEAWAFRNRGARWHVLKALTG